MLSVSMTLKHLLIYFVFFCNCAAVKLLSIIHDFAARVRTNLHFTRAKAWEYELHKCCSPPPTAYDDGLQVRGVIGGQAEEEEQGVRGR